VIRGKELCQGVLLRLIAILPKDSFPPV